MHTCETGCTFGITTAFGGSLLRRRCTRCGMVEVDVRRDGLGVSALLPTTYLRFDPDLEGFERQRGQLN